MSLCREAAGAYALRPANGPNGAAWTIAPVLGDGFKLKASSPLFMPETNIGPNFRRSIAIRSHIEVAGAYTTLAWPLLTDVLMHMALDRDAAQDLYSYSIDYFTPVDPRYYVGVLAETMALRVTGTGDGDFQIEMGLRGKNEIEDDALTETNFAYGGRCVPFMFNDAVIRLDGAVVADVEEFTIDIDNNVAAGPMIRTAGIDIGTVGWLIASQRRVALTLTKLNNNDRFNQAIRTGALVSFEAHFYHPDGPYLGIQLPNLVTEESDESAGETEPTKEAPSLVAVVPCRGDNDIIWEYDDDIEAGHTSTLGALHTSTTTTAAPTTTTAAPTTTTAAP